MGTDSTTNKRGEGWVRVDGWSSPTLRRLHKDYNRVRTVLGKFVCLESKSVLWRLTTGAEARPVHKSPEKPLNSAMRESHFYVTPRFSKIEGRAF